MKNCPYCAEEIQDEAVKCKHCGEFLDGRGSSSTFAPPLPWYDRPFGLLVVIGIAGPLALPLVWRHPRLSPVWKVLISLGILALTWLLIESLRGSLKMLKELEETLGGI